MEGVSAASGSGVEVRPALLVRWLGWAGSVLLGISGVASAFLAGASPAGAPSAEPLPGSLLAIRAAELAFAVLAAAWSLSLLRLATARWVFDAQGVVMRGVGYDRRHGWMDVRRVAVDARHLTVWVNSGRRVLAYPDARTPWETIRSWSSTSLLIAAESAAETGSGSRLSARRRRLGLALAFAAIAGWWLVGRVLRAWLP